MKKCKSCGNSCPDGKNNCPSCGSNQFNVICNNCGTAFDEAYCPNCGVKRGDEGKECPVCNKKYFSAACPDCGYAPNKGNTVVINNGTTNKQEKKKGVTFWKVLLWILFLPVMGSIAIWKSNMKKGVKIGLISVIAIITILICVGGGNGNTKQNNNETRYVNDDYINHFINEVNKTRYPFTEINPSADDYKCFGTVNNCYIEMYHPGDKNFSIVINGGGNQEATDRMFETFRVIAVVLDYKIYEPKIDETIELMKTENVQKVYDMGKFSASYTPCVELSNGVSSSKLDIACQYELDQ